MSGVVDTENMTRPLSRRAEPAGVARARTASELTVVGRFYEVHKYLGSRWELSVVCDDKESATSEAKSILENSKISVGVRVLRVIAQENKSGDVTFIEQTIFRQSPVDEHNAEASARLMRAWQEVESAREQRRLDRIHDQMGFTEDEEEDGDGWRFDRMRIILGLTVLAWIVVMAMFVVHQHLV
jgi:hypothetical protein